jgi:photosystem II stability/assembly factor-like uncharacterized protein
MVFISSDGAVWKTYFPNSGINDLQSIAWTGKQFIAVGAGGIMTSEDGISWRDRFLDPGKYLNSVAWTGKQNVVVGDYGVVFISEDGISWFDHLLEICLAH